MNRVFSTLAFLIICYLVYGFYISQFEFQLFTTKNKKSSLFYDYRLSSNIHTYLSLGSGTEETITEEAKRARQDFIMITDVDLPVYDSQDHYNDRIGILYAEKKINDAEKIIQYKLQKNSSLIDLKYHAHPINKSYDQASLAEQSYDGFEVFNLKSITQNAWRQSKLSTLWSVLFYIFNPRLALMRLYNEPTEELRLFDQLSENRSLSMFLGAEASARAIPITNLLMKFPSYERTLSVSSQHLLLTSELTGDMTKDNVKIIEALKKGQFYISFDELGDPTGFEAYVITGKNKPFSFMGSHITLAKDIKIFYKLPAEPNIFFEVVLYRNGKRADHLNTSEGLFTIKQPGTYRLQIRLSPTLPLPDATKWLTWIYTNNFYIHLN